MRWVLLVVGVVLSLLGLTWTLQGLQILGGSAMSGKSFWIWAGIVTVVAGLVFLYKGIRKGTR